MTRLRCGDLLPVLGLVFALAGCVNRPPAAIGPLIDDDGDRVIDEES